MYRKLWLSAATLALGCSTATSPNDTFVAAFDVEVSAEVFTVRVVTTAQAAALRARMQSGTRGVITGALRAGNGGFNSGFSWHLDPATVEAPDLAIELCDGRPSMVEASRQYWLDSVRQFCPWGAKVIRERTGG